MTSVTISVRGSDETSVPAELAEAHIAIAFEGRDRNEVLATLHGAADAVRQALRPHQDAGCVSNVVADQARVNSHRPWNRDGELTEIRYSGAANITPTFTDFEALSEFITQVAEIDAVQVGHISWSLTRETKTRVEQEVAARAVHVAVARAESYARALGLTQVEPRNIADHGLLGHADQALRAEMMTAYDAGGSFEFEPEAITVSATVEASFIAL